MQAIHRIPNFLLVAIIPHTISDEDAFKDLKESKALVDAYGGKVQEFVVQRREVHDKGMYIGHGKLEEVAAIVREKKIDVVVLHDVIKPGQIYKIQSLLYKTNKQIKVWDRIDLILEIFAAHARSADAKLQIELASMRHMGPRIYGMGFVMSRQGGGIGTLGVGETNTELMKRHWRTQRKKVEDKLNKHKEDRERQLARRSKNGAQTVSIIGYTNAGKTSLFNLLTGKKNISNNALFVTLDSSTGKLFLPNKKKEVILTDTIGFIQNLPTSLIDAFKSTLLEATHADVLLHVIDISDEDWEKKISVVEKILYEMGIERKKKMYVFNKIDAIEKLDKQELFETYERYNPQYISIKNKEGIDALIATIDRTLDEEIASVSQSAHRRKIIHL